MVRRTLGEAARRIVMVWVMLLVASKVATVLAFVTVHICIGVVLIFVIAMIAVAPSLFLICSGI